MTTVSRKYYEFLLEIYGDFQRTGKIEAIRNYAAAHDVNRNISIIMREMGLVKSIGPTKSGVWEWIGGEPTETTAQRMRTKMYEKNQAYLKRCRDKKETQKSIPQNIRHLVSFDDIFNKIMDGIEIAKKYEIPEDKWRVFIKDTYF